MDKNSPSNYSTLALAYIGDAVYELYVRKRMLEGGNCSSGELHKRAVAVVNANAQFDAANMILPLLTPDEVAVFKRGRNTKTNNIPKNAAIAHYRYATGLEAVIGYLYLTNNIVRLESLMDTILQRMN